MHVIRPVGLSLTSLSGASDADPNWSAGTTYAKGSRVSRLGLVYVSSIDNNSSLPPENEVQELEGARWIKISATNTTATLDGSPSVRTTGTSPLVLEYQADGNFNAIALLDLDCQTCLVEVIDANGVVKSSSTITTGAEPVGTWWDWLRTNFFSNSRRHILRDLSGFAGEKIRVTITGASVALGEIMAGRAVRVGSTLMDNGTVMRRKTFTTITTNDFGNVTVKKRAIARDVNYAIHAPRAGFEAIERLLDELDGRRVVTYALEGDWPQFINIGFITDYELPAELPKDFIFTVTTQGVK